MTRREGKRRGVRRETMSGGGGDEMNGRWGLVGGRRKGPFVAAALSFRKKCVCSFFEMAGEAGERLPLGKSVQFCAYLLVVGALAARLSDG